MIVPKKMLCVFAHPDDESLGMGGAIARYAAEGVEIHLVCATRGEKGRFGDAVEKPAPDLVGRTREIELWNAARTLGIRSVTFLNYTDGVLDRAEPRQAIRRIVHEIRRRRPDVVVTFAPDGAYGHPDHIAISQFTTAAVTAAADPSYSWDEKWTMNGSAHRVSKLYYLAWGKEKWDAYQAALKRLVSKVDGVERQANPWPEWAITTRVDAAPYWRRAWEAICCHRTQMSVYRELEKLPLSVHEQLWGRQEFYRAFSLVNGGRQVETDLFEGLRDTSTKLRNTVGEPREALACA
jgi:LmbE family N-acetylglucosaminyl deacetylase